MKKVKKYILGGLAASMFFYVPFIRKSAVVDKKMDDNEDNKKANHEFKSSLNLLHFDKAIKNDSHTLYGSALFGRQVLFHKMTDHADFSFQNYAFAGNIINVYKNKEGVLNFDIQLFLSNVDLCFDEIKKITNKETSKGLILKGFERSELQLV